MERIYFPIAIFMYSLGQNHCFLTIKIIFNKPLATLIIVSDCDVKNVGGKTLLLSYQKNNSPMLSTQYISEQEGFVHSGMAIEYEIQRYYFPECENQGILGCDALLLGELVSIFQSNLIIQMNGMVQIYQCCSMKIAERVMAIHCEQRTPDGRHIILFNEKYFFEQYTVYVIAKVQVNKSGKE
jgi:hypothetical protein